MKHYFLTILLIISATGQLFAQSDTKVKLKIASYNLRMDTPNDGENAWPNRKEMVKSLVCFYDFDVFGVQEAFTHMVKGVAEVGSYDWRGVGRDDGKEKGERCSIFFKKEKYTLLDEGTFWYAENPDEPGKGWDAKCCNRICSWVKLKDKASGKVFFVFNSHFDHQGKVARRESAKLLNIKIKEIAGDATAFSVGDFNATPDSEPIKTILKAGILRDSYKVSEQTPYGTYGTYQGFNVNSSMTGRIDFIFITKAVRVLKFATLNTIQNGRFPSDHFPVVIDVEF